MEYEAPCTEIQKGRCPKVQKIIGIRKFIFIQKKRQNVYNTTYYIVKGHFVQKTAIILWVSYGYPMGILWSDHYFSPINSFYDLFSR